MLVAFYLVMTVLGTVMGSFLCCQVRRAHWNEPVGKSKRKSKAKKITNARSICMHCKRQLKWYENVPVISWLMLGGKCKKCGKKIGTAEILAEVGVGLMFLGLSVGMMWSGEYKDVMAVPVMTWAVFAITIVAALILAYLAIYDGLYGELPGLCLTLLMICAIITVILREWGSLSGGEMRFEALAPAVIAALIFGGVYLVLYLASRGKWVGDGDWIVAAAIGLLLGHPWLALIALFVANFAATIVMYPVVRKKKNHMIYFGPFLVVGYVVTAFLSPWLMGLI